MITGGMLESQALGGALGMALGSWEDKRQLKQQDRLNANNVKYMQQMGVFNREQQMKLWEDTNYDAQRKQMIKAGLNPGLMYGMGGGAGGTTQATPGQAPGGHANQKAGAMEGMAIMQQLNMQKAQKDLIEAQTENVKADTVKKSGVETDLGRATIENLKTEVKSKEAQIKVTEIEKALKDMELFEKGLTQDKRIEQITNNANIAFEKLTELANSNEITRQTMEAQINTIKAKEIGQLLENELSRRMYDKMGAEMEKWLQEIDQRGESLDLEAKKQELEKELRTRGLDQSEIRLYMDAGGMILEQLTKGKSIKSITQHANGKTSMTQTVVK